MKDTRDLVLFARKREMFSFFNGKIFRPCTKLELCENRQVMENLIAVERVRSLKKPQIIALRKLGLEENYKLRSGNYLDPLLLKGKVRVTSRSKGKGFSGVMKKHGMSGGNASHGAKTHRKVGSVGALTGKIWKGRALPGRMGCQKTTLCCKILNFRDGSLYVEGSVSGPKDGLVELRIWRDGS